MRKLNKFGYTKMEVLIVILLLGVVAFVAINKTSYAFEIDKGKTINEVIKLVELQAQDYGKEHLEIFNDADEVYILVDDLVEAGYLLGDEKGIITDPTDINKSYNNGKIRLIYDREKQEVSACFID